MSGSNAGVPTGPPADRPVERGPFKIWRGHPSPIPWFGRFEAHPDFWYDLADRRSEARFSQICHECIVMLIYRFGGFCDVHWHHIAGNNLACDWCDRLLAPSALTTLRSNQEPDEEWTAGQTHGDADRNLGRSSNGSGNKVGHRQERGSGERAERNQATMIGSDPEPYQVRHHKPDEAD